MSKSKNMTSTTTTKNKSEMTPAERAAAKAARKAARKAEREAEKAARPAPVNFRQTVAPESLNAEGRLTTSDVVALGYDEEKHVALEREDFASENLWLLFRAGRLRARAVELNAKADRLEAEAKTAVSFADPAKRASAKKVVKLANAFAELKAALEKDGIDVAALLAATGKS